MISPRRATHLVVDAGIIVRPLLGYRVCGNVQDIPDEYQDPLDD